MPGPYIRLCYEDMVFLNVEGHLSDLENSSYDGVQPVWKMRGCTSLNSMLTVNLSLTSITKSLSQDVIQFLLNTYQGYYLYCRILPS